jgi:hypothetical protein
MLFWEGIGPLSEFPGSFNLQNAHCNFSRPFLNFRMLLFFLKAFFNLYDSISISQSLIWTP